MASQLRTIATKGKGQIDLLQYLANLFNVKLIVNFNSPFPDESNSMSFNKYMRNIVGVSVHSTPLTNENFVKMLANSSGEFLHIKPDADFRYLTGENLIIGNLSANQHKLLSIAQTTSSVAHSLFDYLEQLPKEELDRINEVLISKK